MSSLRCAVIDIRCLLTYPRAGVARYVESYFPILIKELFLTHSHILLFSSGIKKPYLPEWLKELCLSNEKITHTHIHIPNKILTLFADVGCGILYDTYCEKIAKIPHGSIRTWWVMDPAPWRVRSSTEVHVVVHDCSLVWFPFLYPKRWGRAFQWRFRKSIRARVSSWNTVSEATAWSLSEAFPDIASRIKILPDLFLETTAQLSTKKSCSILFLSTVQPRKRLDAVLSAWKLVRLKHPEVTLIVMGAKGWLSEESEKKCREEGVIRIVDATEKQKEDLLRTVAVVVMVSWDEGLGIPVREAQKYGAAVVCSPLPSLLIEGDAIYPASFYDSRGIADALLHALHVHAHNTY